MKKTYLILCLLVQGILYAYQTCPETVTIAILAKDKAHTLPEYLHCLEEQTWPQDKTYIYIRTNNNNDETAAILRDWVQRVQHKYLEVYFDDSDVEEQVQQYKQHEWNCTRFIVLGKIREDSARWAEERNSHYFVADCDNFIKPHTIKAMVDTNLPIVAPFLKCAESSFYSNYHANIDTNGYFVSDPLYYSIFRQEIKGLIDVPVVHCTYLVRSEVLRAVRYNDGSFRYEYVIFSDCARKAHIPQYLDNREIYGRITMTEDRDGFVSEPWYGELALY
jgi:hypothetical protein